MRGWSRTSEMEGEGQWLQIRQGQGIALVVAEPYRGMRTYAHTAGTITGP